MVKMDLIRLCHLSKDLQKEKEFTVLMMVGRTSQAKGMAGPMAVSYLASPRNGAEARGFKKNEPEEHDRARGQR